MPTSSVSSLTDNSTWKCSTCKTFTCALVGTCLLKHSETPSGWGALPLFFLAQRGNKGSRSNQIRHSAIHQSIGFPFLRGVASKHMRTEQPAISHCHCMAYQTSALVWCNFSLRNISKRFDKPRRHSLFLLWWGWPAWYDLCRTSHRSRHYYFA